MENVQFVLEPSLMHVYSEVSPVLVTGDNSQENVDGIAASVF